MLSNSPTSSVTGSILAQNVLQKNKGIRREGLAPRDAAKDCREGAALCK
jgi:hypothetical protein